MISSQPSPRTKTAVASTPQSGGLPHQFGQDLVGLVFNLMNDHEPMLFLQHEQEFFGQVQGGEECQPAGCPLRQPDGASEYLLGDGVKASD